MDIIVKISEFIIPVIVFAVLLHGIVKKRPVYEDFTEGAKEGVQTVFSILPTLIGLMVGIKVISASGLLNDFAKLISYGTRYIGIPSQVLSCVFSPPVQQPGFVWMCLTDMVRIPIRDLWSAF